MWYMKLIQAGLVPDGLVRAGIRRRLWAGLRPHQTAPTQNQLAAKRQLIEQFKQNPIAVHVELANEQHYEVPAAFFQLVLGKHLKYSACYWKKGVQTLNEAEAAMLELTCQRAGLEDGMLILELGCGWGSLSLWMAEHYPKSQITAVSNSNSQREFIQAQAQARGLHNLTVITADMNTFEPPHDHRFDRVVSVEMFEHMKNYKQLMANISAWLVPGGKLFVHHFSHQKFLYEFDHTQPQNWMARYFFAGGTMPSDDLLLYFQDDLKLVEHWRVNGKHYEKTLNAWLSIMDKQASEARRIIRDVYGEHQEDLWFTYWRLFFIACAETFGLNNGDEYFVTHLLFEKPDHA